MNALYPVVVTHTRLRPRRHHLRYRALYALLDIDALPACRLFSYGRFNLFGVDPRDYGDGGGALRPWVEEVLRSAGLATEGGRIALLTMPRFLGHAFNPLSLVLCHGRDGELLAVLYEVNNTFGQRHTYLVPLAPGSRPPFRHGCGKSFYVSPFMDMALRYEFTLQPPAEALGLHIAVDDAEGTVLRATLAGRREALTDRALLRAAVAYAFLGVKVLAAIHWEALRLWLKGLRLRPRPPASTAPISIATETRT